MAVKGSMLPELKGFSRPLRAEGSRTCEVGGNEEHGKIEGLSSDRQSGGIYHKFTHRNSSTHCEGEKSCHVAQQLRMCNGWMPTGMRFEHSDE